MLLIYVLQFLKLVYVATGFDVLGSSPYPGKKVVLSLSNL